MEKMVEHYLGLPYTIELTPEPEGGWFVAVKELPGCISQGDTAEEAVEMIMDAMEGWIEVALEDGDPIPEPRSLDDYSGKFVVRLPRSLHRDVVDVASQEGTSLNQYVNVALARSVGRPGPPERTVMEESGWPGLQSVVQRVLTTAGFTKEAGELDERLFADWAERCLSQVQSALEGGYHRDALWCLDTLAHGLKVGIDKSPIIASFYRTVSLLHQQIETNADLRQGMVDGLVMRARVSQRVQGMNRAFAEMVIQEERVAYSETSTQRSAPEEYVQQLFGDSSRSFEW